MIKYISTVHCTYRITRYFDYLIKFKYILKQDNIFCVQQNVLAMLHVLPRINGTHKMFIQIDNKIHT